MNKEVYEELKKIQNIHWWFVAKREIVLDMFEHFCQLKPLPKILDVGCGMGLMLESLQEYGEVYGVDASYDAVEYCQNKWGKNIIQGTLPGNISFEKGSFDVVVALDVLEHIDDDKAALHECYELLNKDGVMLITVPALNCLWGYNDVAVQHKRRYNKQDLISKCKQEGFKIEKCSYYNFWLSGPIWLVRKVKNILKIEKDDMQGKVRDNFINKILYRIFSSEKFHLRRGGYPFGVSLILVAKK